MKSNKGDAIGIQETSGSANGKIALITGGSRGLGKNMAINLAEKGIDIIITYHKNEADAAEVVREIEQIGRKAFALQLDTSETKGFDEFFKHLATTLKKDFDTQKIDFLINNAGTGHHAAFVNNTENDFDALMNIHFKGPYFLTQKALPFLADGGGIVNISSGLARFAVPGSSAYASMKGAMETLTRYQAKELGFRKIRANVVAPGAIETDFNGGGVRDNKQMNEFVASVTALGRAGLPDDVGGVVAFLCSNDGRWVNGQRIEVSGGMML